jgi:hypothetical protein
LTPKQIAAKLKRHPKGINLNLGCGETLQRDDTWVGIDMLPVSGAIQHDLEVYPWPLPDSCARMAVAGCVLPHINPAKFGVIRFMDEVWRILKYDCDFMLTTQYGVSEAWIADPTHVSHFNEQSFMYFDPLHASKLYEIYRPKPWHLKFANFQTKGIMEIVMSKRRIDSSYKVREIA